jgi:hypothetical protein
MWHTQLTNILARFNAEIVSLDKICVFTLENFPMFMIKLQIAEYPLNMSYGLGVMSDEAAPMQLISRVLAAQSVNKFIAKEGLALIDPINKWLYPIPGTPAQRDISYAVIAERVLYNPDDQVVRLASFLAGAGISPTEITDIMRSNGYSNRDFASEEHGELLEQIIQVITHEGLWNIYSNRNITGANIKLYTGTDGLMHATFIDLERPALGGGDPTQFWHQNPQEIINNGNAGMNEFGPLIQDAYDQAYTPATVCATGEADSGDK